MTPPDPVFEADCELGQDDTRPFGLDIHASVFLISAGMMVLFVVVALQLGAGPNPLLGAVVSMGVPFTVVLLAMGYRLCPAREAERRIEAVPTWA